MVELCTCFPIFPFKMIMVGNIAGRLSVFKHALERKRIKMLFFQVLLTGIDGRIIIMLKILRIIINSEAEK